MFTKLTILKTGVTSPIIRSGTLRRCEPRLYPSTKLWKGSVRSTCGSAASRSAGSVGRSRWFDHPPLLGEHLDEAVAASWRTCGGALADYDLFEPRSIAAVIEAAPTADRRGPMSRLIARN